MLAEYDPSDGYVRGGMKIEASIAAAVGRLHRSTEACKDASRPPSIHLSMRIENNEEE